MRTNEYEPFKETYKARVSRRFINLDEEINKNRKEIVQY
jgi:hypothetical protein